MDKYQKRWQAIKEFLRPKHSWIVTIDNDSTFALRSDSPERNATVTCSLLPTKTEVKIIYRGYRRDETTIDLSGIGHEKRTTTTESSLNFTLPIFTKGEPVWSIWNIAAVRSFLFYGHPIWMTNGLYPTLLEYVKKGEDFRRRYNENAEQWKNKE